MFKMIKESLDNLSLENPYDSREVLSASRYSVLAGSGLIRSKMLGIICKDLLRLQREGGFYELTFQIGERAFVVEFDSDRGEATFFLYPYDSYLASEYGDNLTQIPKLDLQQEMKINLELKKRVKKINESINDSVKVKFEHSLEPVNTSHSGEFSIQSLSSVEA